MMALMHTDFSGSGRTGDEEVRHLRQIVHDLVALEIPPQHHRQHPGGAAELGTVDEIADVYEPGSRIRDLDTNRRLSRNRRHDAQRLRAHREREIVGERRHAPHLHAATRLELEARDDRTDRLVDDLRPDAERLERRDQPPAHVLDLRRIGVFDCPRSLG